ncbi:putative polyketide synthase [Botryosphaeria dothidea]|uniref:Polyketide synthase n=1 Tax=Botryosphaeria dothidea TaxID=55169 RepID=A0A8H4IL94_9PEZI|nr:putative polyketide synthase [Botryosphaeria dothidea]
MFTDAWHPSLALKVAGIRSPRRALAGDGDALDLLPAHKLVPGRHRWYRTAACVDEVEAGEVEGAEGEGVRCRRWGVMEQDLKCAVLAATLDAEGSGEDGGSGVAGAGAAAERLKGLQPGVTKALVAGEKTGSLSAAVLRCVRRCFSNLILTPVKEVDLELMQFGMDVMIAAEFRGWVWGTWKVDVPLFDLLGRESSLKRLAEFVEKKLSEHREDQQ